MDGFNKTLRRQLLAVSADQWAGADRSFHHAVTQAILCHEEDVADPQAAARYFGPPRFPGTTSIGYRKIHPEIFQDTTDSVVETYENWVYRSFDKILNKMRDMKYVSASDFPVKENTAEFVQKISFMLALETAGGIPLCDSIPQQMYEDTFIRMVLFLLGNEDAGETINFYEEFNAIGRRIALTLIDQMERSGMLGLHPVGIARIIQLAVLSGYIGINLKSSASAASKLLNRNFVPLNAEWIRSCDAVSKVSEADLKAVVDHLLAVSEVPEGQFGLESLRQYQEEVVETSTTTLVVFFCDDYIESLIDLKRFEVMLDANPYLHVLFIPRNGRYGNDIAYEDMGNILQEPQFPNIQAHLASGRFIVSPHGPRSGCIDPRYISRHLIDEIHRLGEGKRVVFETKGCRNFEMIQGNLQIPWYAGFNCNRALSIRTVGVDGPPVFIRIPPGLKAYDGFIQPVMGLSPSYPATQIKFARMTTRQLFTALESPAYQSLVKSSKDELRLNKSLAELGENTGLLFNELIGLFTPNNS